MIDFNISVFKPETAFNATQADAVASFLHQHLDQYGDPQDAIRACIAYAMQEVVSPGGFVVVCQTGETIIGAVVVNKTGMKNYIPENILVYIALHQDYRGKGIGGKLMKTAIDTAEGDIALHVEADNPAKRLYEKLGFENKYLEMRLHR